MSNHQLGTIRRFTLAYDVQPIEELDTAEMDIHEDFVLTALRAECLSRSADLARKHREEKKALDEELARRERLVRSELHFQRTQWIRLKKKTSKNKTYTKSTHFNEALERSCSSISSLASNHDKSTFFKINDHNQGIDLEDCTLNDASSWSSTENWLRTRNSKRRIDDLSSDSISNDFDNDQVLSARKK
jgi:hypothetical protein